VVISNQIVNHLVWNICNIYGRKSLWACIWQCNDTICLIANCSFKQITRESCIAECLITLIVSRIEYRLDFSLAEGIVW